MNFIDLKKQYAALKTEIDAGIAKVLADGRYIGGEEVGLLAERLAEYCGVKHCLPCANGTDALTLALRCLNVGPNDAIFLPTFTFFSGIERFQAEG